MCTRIPIMLPGHLASPLALRALAVEYSPGVLVLLVDSCLATWLPLLAHPRTWERLATQVCVPL